MTQVPENVYINKQEFAYSSLSCKFPAVRRLFNPEILSSGWVTFNYYFFDQKQLSMQSGTMEKLALLQ